MKIAIVGGTGSFGLALAQRVAAAGYDVVIGSRDAGRAGEAAAGIGGNVTTPDPSGLTTGGDGIGGTINIDTSGGTIDLGALTGFGIFGRGGTAQVGGAGTGGALNVDVRGGTIDLGDGVLVVGDGTGGAGTSLGGSRHCGAPPPWANTQRAPESTSACTAASACSGVARLCDQSSSVVMPESSASSVPSRLPA